MRERLGSASGGQASRGELAVGRARARRAARGGRECAGCAFGRCRERAGKVAARAGEGGRTPRGSCKRPREGIRAYAQCSASCPWPSTRASSWAGSSFSSCGRGARRSRRERVSDDGVRRDRRRARWEDGRGRPVANATPRADRRACHRFRRTHTSSHFAVVSTMCASKSACRFAGSSILLARNRVSHPMVSRTGRTARAFGMPAEGASRPKRPANVKQPVFPTFPAVVWSKYFAFSFLFARRRCSACPACRSSQSARARGVRAARGPARGARGESAEPRSRASGKIPRESRRKPRFREIERREIAVARLPPDRAFRIPRVNVNVNEGEHVRRRGDGSGALSV